MALTKQFCWTRFGVEAGESVEQILRRKERERVCNGGVFLWGIGSAIGPSLQRLLHMDPNPEVVFSPIRAPPKKIDVSPHHVLNWLRGQTMWGSPFEFPPASKVT